MTILLTLKLEFSTLLSQSTILIDCMKSFAHFVIGIEMTFQQCFRLRGFHAVTKSLITVVAKHHCPNASINRRVNTQLYCFQQRLSHIPSISRKHRKPFIFMRIIFIMMEVAYPSLRKILTVNYIFHNSVQGRTFSGSPWISNPTEEEREQGM